MSTTKLVISAVILFMGIMGILWAFRQPCSLELPGLPQFSLPETIQRLLCFSGSAQMLIITSLAGVAILVGGGGLFQAIINIKDD